MEIEVAVHDAARAVLEAAGVEAATLRVVDVDYRVAWSTSTFAEPEPVAEA